MEPTHFVSACCIGERCGPCFRGGMTVAATHKVEETLFHDDPVQMRHPYTQYICCLCFMELMGPAVDCFHDGEKAAPQLTLDYFIEEEKPDEHA